MSKKRTLIQGTLILTLTGFISRIIGFFYRVFLSQTIGAKGMGIYQLIFPVHTLCFAICVGGLQTAISQLVAGSVGKKEWKNGKGYFKAALYLCLVISCLLSFLVFLYADYLSITFLQEPRCTPLLKMLALSIPFGCVHACIIGYYYALKQTAVPSISVLLEQCARVGATYFAFIYMTSNQKAPTALIAVSGILAGELVSMLFSGIMLYGHFHFTPQYKTQNYTSDIPFTNEVLKLSIPLTANRVLLNLMHSVETILIPTRLRLHGYSTDASLSMYGILSGMAIPLILFPSAITSSVSVMLLPAIAEENAKGNQKSIRDTIDSTIKYCLILGILSTGIFYMYGKTLGMLMFHNPDCGIMIQTLAPICPFLYLTSTLSSVMNGLGKTTFNFIQNIIGLAIRILFVFFIIPTLGIKGYLWGLLLSEGVITICCAWYLRRLVHFEFSLTKRVLVPGLGLLICIGITEFFRFLFIKNPSSFVGLCLQVFVLCATYGFYLFSRGLIHVPVKKHLL